MLATHELDEAERLADRVVIFDRGRIVADGTLAELRRGHDEIRFRSAPTLDTAALDRGDRHCRSARSAPASTSSTPHPSRGCRQLTGWLADHDQPLDDLRAGAQRLEDVFLPPHGPATRPTGAARRR